MLQQDDANSEADSEKHHSQEIEAAEKFELEQDEEADVTSPKLSPAASANNIKSNNNLASSK